MVSGHVQFMIETAGSVLPQVLSGSARALAVTGERRMAVLADVPTMQEAGLKGYVYTTWYGLWAPAHTPDTILSRLNAATAKVLAAAGTIAAFEKAGIEAESASTERFGVMVRSELARWTGLFRRLALRSARTPVRKRAALTAD